MDCPGRLLFGEDDLLRNEFGLLDRRSMRSGGGLDAGQECNDQRSGEAAGDEASDNFPQHGQGDSSSTASGCANA
jgi:hypothetical protein